MDIREVPRSPRRGLRPETPEDKPEPGGNLQVTSQVLLDALDELADIRAALKVPLSAERAERRAFEVVDADAPIVIPNLEYALAHSAAAQAESGVTVAALQEGDDRLDLMSDIFFLVTEAEERVGQSLRVLAKVQRDAHAQLDRVARQALLGKDLSDQQKEELTSDLRGIERDVTAISDSRSSAAARTSAQKDKNAAAVAEEQRREEMLRTIARLKRGDNPTAEEIRRAYETLQRSDDERRDSSRK